MTSNRQLALRGSDWVADETQAPFRVGQVVAALRRQGYDVSTWDISRGLVSLARTGHLAKVGTTVGIKSGGTSLYWPTQRGAPPPATGGDTGVGARVVDAVRRLSHLNPERGLSTREVLDALVENREAPTMCTDGRRVDFGQVYAILRNLERRKRPLISRRTDHRGHVTWWWCEQPEGACDRMSPSMARTRSLAEGEQLRLALEAAAGHHGVPVIPVSAVLSAAPGERDEIQRSLRRAISQTQRAGGSASACHGHEMRLPAVHVVGWVGGACMVTASINPGAKVVLSSMRAFRLLRTLKQQQRLARRMIVRGHTGRRLMEEHQAVMAVRAGQLADVLRITGHHGTPMWRQRIQEHLGIAEQLLAVNRGCADQVNNSTAVQWVSAEHLRHLLLRLVGPRAPTTVLLRRLLDHGPVWRSWLGDGWLSPRTGARVTSTLSGREPLVWERTGALLYAGVRLGGPSTRAHLRVIAKSIGEARPAPDWLADQGGDPEWALVASTLCAIDPTVPPIPLPSPDLTVTLNDRQWVIDTAREIEAAEAGQQRSNKGGPWWW
jgi:hypothetical protein